MADATRDAKLKLTLESADAARGMQDLVRAGEAVAKQQDRIAEAGERANRKLADAASRAARTIERYGENELSKPEWMLPEKKYGRQKVGPFVDRDVAAVHRQSDAAQKAVDEYRLKKHYDGLRKEKADKAAAAAENDRIHDDAMKRVEEYRLAKHYKQLRQQRAEEAAEKEKGEEEEGKGKGSTMKALLSGASAAAAALTSLAVATRHTLNVYNNASLTNSQRTMSILDPTGLFTGLGREITGRTERMRLLGIQRAEAAAVHQQIAQNNARYYPATTEAASAEGRAAAFAGTSVAPARRFDRSTLAGEIAHGEEQQRIPARDAAMNARIEADAAQAAVRAARQTLDEVTTQRDAATEHRRDWDRNVERARRDDTFSNGTDGEILQGAIHQRQSALERESSLINEQIAARQRHQDLVVAAAQAEGRARETIIAQMRTELQLGQQIEQRLVASATRLGGQSWLDRRLGLQAARQIRDRGIENVTPQVRQHAAATFPEYVEQQQRRFGETTEEFRAGRREGFDTPGSQSIGEQRELNARLQDQIRENTLQNARDVSSAVGVALREGLQQMATEFTDQIARVRREVQARFEAMAAQQ